jgi:dTDP-glucose 4,6-dehydratase
MSKPLHTPVPGLRTALLTGGAGFIGTNLIRFLLQTGEFRVVNLDKLTYAANRDAVSESRSDSQILHEGDICDADLVARILREYRPDAVVHLAAETHVDRSIASANSFVVHNVVGTSVMLSEALAWWQSQHSDARNKFRFLHVSTDEVFGSLGPEDAPFHEDTPYAPNNPYSASKAASDHLVRAFFRTYGLPTITVNASNNYGPFQHPEKLIPLAITKALKQEPIPVYGTGRNVRDWLYVLDHCRALLMLLEAGRPGETYCVGGGNERANLEVVQEICLLMDSHFPEQAPHSQLVTLVPDRPGHDWRYASNSRKMREQLGWAPLESFREGLRKTVDWYVSRAGSEPLL